MTPVEGAAIVCGLMADPGDRFVVRVDADLLELVPHYFANRRRDLETVRQALERGDYEPVRVVGHRIRGSGAGYGFEGLSDIGGELERAARDGDVSAMQRCADAIRAYLDRVEVV